jgi:hypothetical protein
VGPTECRDDLISARAQKLQTAITPIPDIRKIQELYQNDRPIMIDIIRLLGTLVKQQGCTDNRQD